MPLYWTDASVPELAKLTRGQRRRVRCAAYKMLRAEHPGTPLLMGLFCGLGVFFGYFLAWPVSRLTTAGDPAVGLDPGRRRRWWHRRPDCRLTSNRASAAVFQ